MICPQCGWQLVDLDEEFTAAKSIATGIHAEDLARGWNEAVAGKYQLPRVLLPLSKQRLTKAAARVREHPEPEWWRGVFVAIGQSRFLRGLNGGGSEHHWRVSFDWIISNDTNAVKIVEGQYADQRGG